MKKKVLSLVLTAAMMTTMLAGCSSFHGSSTRRRSYFKVGYLGSGDHTVLG